MVHETHTDHQHAHGPSCGHTKVQHGDHVDYLHDGHLHSMHGDHVDEHALDPSGKAVACGSHACEEHATEHRHGNACGHEPVPHGDHQDYLVGGHLHNQHGEHCDDHGAVKLA